MKREQIMSDDKIARLVAKKIYQLPQDETNVAINLLIERLTMPDSVVSYTEEDAMMYISKAILALSLTERHYCKSCGEELDDYCLKCQKLWES